MRHGAMRALLALVVFAVLPLTPAFANEEALPGTYSVTLTDNGKVKQGTAKVKGDWWALTLELSLSGGVTIKGTCDPGWDDKRLFTLEDKRTLELTPTKSLNATGVLKDGTKVVGSATFTRHRSVLIVHAEAWEASHASFFKLKANEIARYYLNKGYKRRDVIAGTSFEALIAALETAETEGRPYDRVVIIAHGGWDGPIFSGPNASGPSQASGEYNSDLFDRVVEAVMRGTTPQGKVYISACHGGGSDRYEVKDPQNSTYRYADDLAAKAGRWVAGPAGITSNVQALQGVQAALELERGVHQEMRVATADGGQSFTPGKWVVVKPAAN